MAEWTTSRVGAIAILSAVEPIPNSAVQSRTVVASALLTAGILLVVFGQTLAPDLTWANFGQDGGELITAAVTLGVPHPPGYPTYVMLGKLFSLLPLGSVAFRLNLLSAVAVSAVGGLMAALLAVRGQGSVVAVAGGVSVGLLPLVWSQATVAEVYGLNLAFVAACLFCLVGLGRTGLAGFFFGLALTSHLSSLLLLPAVVWLSPPKQFTRLGAGVFLGLLPFLAIPLLARSGSPVVWGNPQTVKGWWWVVSGQLYAANLRLPLTLASLMQSVARPSLWLGPVIIALGLAIPVLARHRDRHNRDLVTFGLGLAAAAYALFALSYQTADAAVLLLPALFILMYLICANWRIGPWLAVLVPLALLLAGFNQQDLSRDHTVRPLAGAVLAAAPQDAIVVTPGDRSIFTLWYFQHVERTRPDLLLVDANLFAFDWYRDRLQAANPQLHGLAIDDLHGLLAANPQRPHCLAGLVGQTALTVPTGYTYRLGAQSPPPTLACQTTFP